ncbi:MAG: Nitroreductase domain-containing protein [Burkholderia sp.]|jgi:nitroreductase / dihydropteridine reductase
MNEMLEIAKRRYTTKHYDPAKRISDKDFADLMEIVRLAPTSVNSQPCHFFYADTKEAKEKLFPAFPDFNIDRVRDASHVVIFTVRADLNEDHIRRVIDKEEADGRFPNAQFKKDRFEHCMAFVNLHHTFPQEMHEWEARQAYIALGTLVFAAAGMGIDSTCIEGLDPAKVDEILGLREKGFRTVCAASLGYRAANDGNASRPKSRLEMKDILTRL